MTDVLNVRSFDARGDGSTDDTAKIQAAIDAASTAGAGVVYLPTGTYIASPLNLKTNVTLLGDGIDHTVIQCRSGETSDIIKMSGLTNAGLTDLTVDGTGGSGSANFPIRIQSSCLQCFVRRVQIRDIAAAEGLWMSDSDECILEDIEAVNIFSWAVYIRNSTGTGRHTLRNIRGWDSDSRLLVIRDSDHNNVQGVGYYDSAGEVLLITGSSQHNVVTGIVGDNLSAGDGMSIEGPAKYNVVDGFTLRNTNGHGMGINGNTGIVGPTNNVVCNGTIDGPGEAGVVCSNQGNNETSSPNGNVISNVVCNNAGRVTDSEAFGVAGGTGNIFDNCVAIAGTGTNYAYNELDGVATVARNRFSGRIEGTFKLADVQLADSEDSEIDVWHGMNTPAVLGVNDNNNYDPGRFAVLRARANAGGSAITGIANGIHGRVLRIYNNSTNTLTIEHEDSASDVTNRITSGTGAAVTLGANDWVALYYDRLNGRWQIVA